MYLARAVERRVRILSPILLDIGQENYSLEFSFTPVPRFDKDFRCFDCGYFLPAFGCESCVDVAVLDEMLVGEVFGHG